MNLVSKYSIAKNYLLPIIDRTLEIVNNVTGYKTKTLIRQIGNARYGATEGKYDVICKTGALTRQISSGKNIYLINDL